MLNVARLRVLKEVAYRGSLSAAAAALDYSQSAVSQQISALETETGMKLLERLPRGVTLTAAGQTLMAHTEAILSRIEAAETALSAIAGLRGGRLRAASFPTAGAALMPLAIASFRAQYPGVELTLAEGEPEEIAPRLLAGELDLALLFEFAGEDLALEGTSVVPLLEDPMYLAMPSAHRLAARSRVRLEDFAEDAWVQTSSSSPCARHVVRCCHAAGFEPLVSFESDDYLIPELALSAVRDDITIRALSPTPPRRRVIAALPESARLVPAAPAMLGILQATAASYAASPRDVAA